MLALVTKYWKPSRRYRASVQPPYGSENRDLQRRSVSFRGAVFISRTTELSSGTFFSIHWRASTRVLGLDSRMSNWTASFAGKNATSATPTTANAGASAGRPTRASSADVSRTSPSTAKSTKTWRIGSGQRSQCNFDMLIATRNVAHATSRTSRRGSRRWTTAKKMPTTASSATGHEITLGIASLRYHQRLPAGERPSWPTCEPFSFVRLARAADQSRRKYGVVN